MIVADFSANQKRFIRKLQRRLPSCDNESSTDDTTATDDWKVTTWQSEGRSLGCDDSQLRGLIREAPGAARGPIHERYGTAALGKTAPALGALRQARPGSQRKHGVSGQTGAA